MSRVAATRVDRWEEMFDRDIENLITGRTPLNTDLLPLRGFVEALRAMAQEELSDEFIELSASESAAVVAALRATEGSANGLGRGKARLLSLRPQLATIAISLALVFGMTGVSWAADRAVPGDWYYPIDRALEAIGIGAGGEAERLDEQQTKPQAGVSDAASIENGVAPEVGTEQQTGLDRAATAVANGLGEGSVSADTRSRTVALLQYLNETDIVDGQTVSELAKGGAGRPEHAAAADRPGPPDDVGKPVEQPGKSGGGQGGGPDKPDSPNKPDTSERGQGSGRP